jgi:hypothetical protein
MSDASPTDTDGDTNANTDPDPATTASVRAPDGDTAGMFDDLDTVVEVGRDRTPETSPWALGTAEVSVPADREDPVADCPYCERPFPTSRARALHVGEAHPDACSDDERAAYEEADEAERDELFVYHLKAVVTIGLTWAGFVLLYMVAIGTNVV